MLGVIDFHGLGQVIWVSLAAGVSVTVLYSFVIYASVKSGEARRGDRAGPGSPTPPSRRSRWRCSSAPPSSASS